MALYDDNLIIAMPASQLIKIINIWAKVVKAYARGNVLISLFTRGWHRFVVEKKDHIVDSTLNDMDLPAKIQPFMGQIVSDYSGNARFGTPNE